MKTRENIESSENRGINSKSRITIYDMFHSLWVVGFVLVLVGSFLLIKQKRYGGIMLIVSTILWAIGYGIDVITIFPYVNIPIGALLCGIVGVVSLVYKK